ncbi:hypothetical protein DFP72DRAFT_859848 [Ephemerocybe angulata]|uniref:Uncharacterized protein n=1 Tax=Ephemerocybe angulata TaxID=980116 RepID=A0A8H6LT48_9AGAR|nr:hypothetical protein DFP72DRAFT_859848 [Tulosesus angulatus]
MPMGDGDSEPRGHRGVKTCGSSWRERRIRRRTRMGVGSTAPTGHAAAGKLQIGEDGTRVYTEGRALWQSRGGTDLAVGWDVDVDMGEGDRWVSKTYGGTTVVIETGRGEWRGDHFTEDPERNTRSARQVVKHPPHTIVCAYSAQSQPLGLAIETRNFCSLIPAEFRPFCQQTLELCFLTFNPPPTSARRTSIHTVFVTQHHRTQHALNRSQTTQDASTLSRRTAIPVWQSSFLTFTAQALTPDRNASGCQQQHPVFRNKIRHVKTILVPYKPLSTSESPAMHTTTTHLATSGLERTGGRWRAAKRTHVDGPSSNPQVAYVIFSQLARRTDFCRVIAISPHPSPIPFRSVGLPACTIPPTPPSGLPSLAGRISVVTWSFSLTTVVTEYFECGRIPRRSRLLAHPLPINSTALAECEGALACFEVHSTTSQSHPSPRIHFYCYFVKETLTELTLAPPYRGSGKKSPFWAVRVPEVHRSANPKIPIVCVISTGVPESVQYHRFTIGFVCALPPAGAAKLVIKTRRHQHPTCRALGPEALSSKSSTLAQYEIRIRRRFSVQDGPPNSQLSYPAHSILTLKFSLTRCLRWIASIDLTSFRQTLPWFRV